jgi:hypothetical protein
VDGVSVVVTSLTLRLFASPTTGLALGLWLITRARHWREVAIPAAGLVTIGVTGTAAILLELGQLAPSTPLGYYVAITPLHPACYRPVPAAARSLAALTCASPSCWPPWACSPPAWSGLGATPGARRPPVRG